MGRTFSRYCHCSRVQHENEWGFKQKPWYDRNITSYLVNVTSSLLRGKQRKATACKWKLKYQWAKQGLDKSLSRKGYSWYLWTIRVSGNVKSVQRQLQATQYCNWYQCWQQGNIDIPRDVGNSILKSMTGKKKVLEHTFRKTNKLWHLMDQLPKLTTRQYQSIYNCCFKDTSW